MNTGNSPSLISLRSHILTMDLHTLNISLRSQNIAYPVKQISEVVFSSWIIDILCFHAKSNQAIYEWNIAIKKMLNTVLRTLYII